MSKKDGEVRVRMPQEWVDAIKAEAERRGEKPSVMVRQAVLAWLEAQGAGPTSKVAEESPEYGGGEGKE